MDLQSFSAFASESDGVINFSPTNHSSCLTDKDFKQVLTTLSLFPDASVWRFSSNRFTDSSIVRLAEFMSEKSFSSLREIYLNDNCFSAKGIQIFLEAVPSSIELLEISENSLGNEIITVLMNKLGHYEKHALLLEDQYECDNSPNSSLSVASTSGEAKVVDLNPFSISDTSTIRNVKESVSSDIVLPMNSVTSHSIPRLSNISLSVDQLSHLTSISRQTKVANDSRSWIDYSYHLLSRVSSDSENSSVNRLFPSVINQSSSPQISREGDSLAIKFPDSLDEHKIIPSYSSFHERNDCETYSNESPLREKNIQGLGRLYHLELRGCGLDDNCWVDLLALLSSPKCHICELHLSSNSFSEASIPFIVAVIKNPLCRLRVLNLGNMKMKSLYPIFEAIEENNSLQVFAMSFGEGEKCSLSKTVKNRLRFNRLQYMEWLHNREYLERRKVMQYFAERHEERPINCAERFMKLKINSN